MQAIRDLESGIRDFINDSRSRHVLLQDTAAWSQLCSSLDIIGDTGLAIEAYCRHEDPADLGERYLLVYGILQVLFVQQDAVEDLAEALKLPYFPVPELRDIREIRNKTTGHPTKRGDPKKGTATSHFLSQHSLSKSGYQLLTTYADGRSEFMDVNIFSLMRRQQGVVRKVLAATLKALEQAEMEHQTSSKTRNWRITSTTRLAT